MNVEWIHKIHRNISRLILTDDLRIRQLTTKNNILASMYVFSDEEGPQSANIFIHNISVLVDPRVMTKRLGVKELKCPIKCFDDRAHFALNTTSLFAVTKIGLGSTIHVWDFWNYEH